MLFLNPKVLKKEPGGESHVNHLTASANVLAHLCCEPPENELALSKSQLEQAPLSLSLSLFLSLPLSLSPPPSLIGPPPFPSENKAVNTGIPLLAIWGSYGGQSKITGDTLWEVLWEGVAIASEG